MSSGRVIRNNILTVGGTNLDNLMSRFFQMRKDAFSQIKSARINAKCNLHCDFLLVVCGLCYK